MTNEHETIAQVLVEDAPAHLPGFLTPDFSLLLLTWCTFFILLIILYKVAWKPILAGLEAREEAIRKSIENADRLNEELAKLKVKTDQAIAQAETEAKKIISESRKAAQEAARVIENKAKEQTQIILENVQRDIKEEMEKARVVLIEESARIAVHLAEKLIAENLDDEKNKKLINRLIREL